jgi:hypothetical protein
MDLVAGGREGLLTGRVVDDLDATSSIEHSLAASGFAKGQVLKPDARATTLLLLRYLLVA